MLARVGWLFARLITYLLIGAAAGALLGIASGAYLGIPIRDGAGRIGAISGTMARLAFFVWVIGEIVRTVKNKQASIKPKGPTVHDK